MGETTCAHQPVLSLAVFIASTLQLTTSPPRGVINFTFDIMKVSPTLLLDGYLRQSHTYHKQMDNDEIEAEGLHDLQTNTMKGIFLEVTHSLWLGKHHQQVAVPFGVSAYPDYSPGSPISPQLGQIH